MGDYHRLQADWTERYDDLVKKKGKEKDNITYIKSGSPVVYSSFTCSGMSAPHVCSGPSSTTRCVGMIQMCNTFPACSFVHEAYYKKYKNLWIR